MTVGIIAVEPGGFNIVPGRCEISVDAGRPAARTRAAPREWIDALCAASRDEEGLESSAPDARPAAP